MKSLLSLMVLLFAACCTHGQLVVRYQQSAQALVQRLVGDGVTVSNVSFTGDPKMAGLFENVSGTNINIDSGIVLTSGIAKSGRGFSITDSIGVNGNGTTAAEDLLANFSWDLPGDVDLATAVDADVSEMYDACVLEFDFVPLGDTIRFNYVFSSEEYTPAFACSEFIDAFAFFISGPGITGLQNLALVPNTTLPVSIFNINNVLENGNALCPQNPFYYVDNISNTFFTHDGHTKVLTAVSRVQPCNSYHMKLVISDNSDDQYDSGVFLEAKSLTSNIVKLINYTQTDGMNNSFIVEGCATGSFKIKRPAATPVPLTVRLAYGGNVVNGVDVQTLPATVTIPANDSIVTVNVNPLIDNVAEGIETLKVYALAACGSIIPIDSTLIQIRDYDQLLLTPDTAIVCRNTPVQLNASPGYTSYQWLNTPGLNNYSIRNPVATPVSDTTRYICTAQLGTCYARDSVYLIRKRLKLNLVTGVNCSNASTGVVSVTTGAGWQMPVQFSINNGALQSTGQFSNLPVGTYVVKANDGTCVDSVSADVVQLYPDLQLTATVMENASCSGARDGVLLLEATGGKPQYTYSSNGINFQANNVLNLAAGTYQVTVKDVNGCTAQQSGVNIPVVNTVVLSTSATSPVICEGRGTPLPATTNAQTVRWDPPTALNDPSLLNPIASPDTTIKYYITATTGVCSKRDSIIVVVNKAPVPDAGPDDTICFGGSARLAGSGGVVYKWSPERYLSDPDIADPVISDATTTTYFLEVTDANGCTSLFKDEVKISVPPPAKLYAGADTAVAVKQPLHLFAADINQIGFTSYSWTPADVLDNPFIKNPTAIISDPETQFIVTATTDANCIGRDTVRVKTYFGPNILVANSFTPNGDGRNDVLRAFPVGIKQFLYFTIYNRYGQQVFTTTDPVRGWDGNVKGISQGINTFVWIASGIDYKGQVISRKGTTTIVR